MATASTVQLLMPEMGESVTEGTVLEWHVEVGEAVEEGQTMVEISTDKVDAEVPAPADGVVTKILVGPDETVSVGDPLAEIDTSGDASASAPSADSDSEAKLEGAETNGASASADAKPAGNGASAAPAAAPANGDQRATPVARRIAASMGVDLASVTGTGAGGKITKDDVIAAGGNGSGAPTPSGPAPQGELLPLRGSAAALAKAMDESRSIPTATSFRTLAVDTLDSKRKAINEQLADRGVKVSFTHLIAWAIVRASAEWPVMARSFAQVDGKPNAVDPGATNLGIAVDVEKKGSRSLMVPCIAGADQMDFAGFHRRYEELITKTREGSLTADDFQGTNITLTNPGGIGTVASVPRLLSGQGTIIATGSIAYPAEWQQASP